MTDDETLATVRAERDILRATLARVGQESASWSQLAREQAAELTQVTAERDAIRAAAERLVNVCENSPTYVEMWAALDQLADALTPEPTEAES